MKAPADGAALDYDEAANDIVVDFHTYGKGYEALMTPHGGFRHPATPESFEYEDFGNGIDVYKRQPYYHYDKPYVFLRDVDIEPIILDDSIILGK